ncbi:hypothetical protein Agub_g11538, partial [Astrephomene gubernaculifera]
MHKLTKRRDTYTSTNRGAICDTAHVPGCCNATSMASTYMAPARPAATSRSFTPCRASSFSSTFHSSSRPTALSALPHSRTPSLSPSARTPSLLAPAPPCLPHPPHLLPLPHRRRCPPPCRAAGVLEGFSGVSNLMSPEAATIFSAIIAISSVALNLYGGLITEKRRAELAREVERERQAAAAAAEERGVVARYRGPLLEASVDLEGRLVHIATLTGEWRSGEEGGAEEEVVYTLFTLAQWLGFLEVIRREG